MSEGWFVYVCSTVKALLGNNFLFSIKIEYGWGKL